MVDDKSGNRWNHVSLWMTFTFYWMIAVVSSRIEGLFRTQESDGVILISVVFFLIIIVCMATQRSGWRVWKRILYLPACFVVHVVLTIPAAAALGILMYSLNHARSVAEQRAVFILASIPILVYSMWQSRLFVREEKHPDGELKPVKKDEEQVSAAYTRGDADR